MQNQPLVTVYIPTFNRVELLKRAVKSVQDQTYQNLEIIIVDDCSTDGTHEYLEQVSKEDKRVRFFLKETNSGACVSRNIAIENANGEFITGLDDDDYFLNNRIAIFLENWKECYSCLFSYNIFKINDNKFILKNKRIKKLVYKDDLLINNYIGNQVFTRLEKIKEAKAFDPSMNVWQDLECWYRLLDKSPAKLVPEKLQVIDISHPHERITKKKSGQVLASFEYFIKKHCLNNRQIRDLETHLVHYEGIQLNYYIYLRKGIKLKSIRMIGLAIKKYLKDLKILYF